jgi:RHS repeat-associated protein
LKSAGGVTYGYDGDGRRVSKSNGKLYWYGSGGDILAETDASGNTTAEYIFFGGKRIAMIPYSGSPAVAGNPIYYVEDLLGTSRVITTNIGVVCYDADFYPFGGERPYTNTRPQNYKFEGKERDSETSIGPGNTNGNDDFGARYYSNRFGRWLSADWSSVPIAVPYANLTNPQTLNLYAMVAADPESFADLDGHCGDGTSAACIVMVTTEPANAAAQAAQHSSAAKDSAIGALKEIGNTLASVNPGSALLGSPFAASNDAQAKAMTGVAILGLLIPGGREEEAAAKVETKVAQAVETKAEEAAVSVYRKAVTQYVGITVNMASREAQHGEKLVPIVEGLTRREAKGVEQALIEHHGLPQNGGTLTNKINSIASKNPIYQEAVAFGNQLLKSIGYFH